MKHKTAVLLITFLTMSYAKASPGKQIIVSARTISLVLTVGDDRKLYQTYLGESLLSSSDYTLMANRHELYTSSGTVNVFEPAISITHDDGNPSLDLRFIESFTHPAGTNSDLTTVVLKDPRYNLSVRLNFKTFKDENVIETWTEIVNSEKGAVKLMNYASAMLHADASAYWLTQFHGDWFGEMKIETSALTSGIKIIDSKLGVKATNYQSPVFMVSLNKDASETEGEVIAGTLAWSGNFKLSFEKDNNNSLLVTAGINSFASEYRLDNGKTFVTPSFLFTYSINGKGEASRNFQKWGINYGVMDGKRDRFTLLNNWEATFFDFTEAKLDALIADASHFGLDMFLLDDGWFGTKYPRNNDGAGLGDWEENKLKLPNGIGHLTKSAAAGGIKFGLWIEPEMVNPKSRLYENHPDWILRLPNREEDLQRNQLVLDLVNPEVQEFIYSTLDRLLTRYPGISYFKWDCNRTLTSAYSPWLKGDQSHLYIDYTKSLYAILERFRSKYPHVQMMLCSSGGGRVEYGALRYFTEFWPSDNTNAYDRVFIQWGYSYFFPSAAVCSHVTSAGNQSLKFKTDVAMSGKLGYDIVFDKLSSDEKVFTRKAIATYHRLKDVIGRGEMFRYLSPYEGEHAVFMKTDSTKDKAVIFSYNLNTRFNQPLQNVRLTGLDPAKKYRVQEINLAGKSSFDFDGKIISGDYLVRAGLGVSSNEALSSAIIELTAVN